MEKNRTERSFVWNFSVKSQEKVKPHRPILKLSLIHIYLLGILLDRNGKLQETRDRAINYAREHRVEKTVIMTAAGAANCQIDYNKIARKGGADMCTVFEEKMCIRDRSKRG